MLLDSFDKIASKPLYPGANHLITRVLLEKPKLHRWGFLVPKHGVTAITVMTVDEVFKGPRNPEQPADIQREYALLQSLDGIDLGVQVPKVTTVARDGSFYGMERMNAEGLTKQTLSALPESEQQRIAEAVGRFNARLATRPAEGPGRNIVTRSAVMAVAENDTLCTELGGNVTVLDRLVNHYLKQEERPLLTLHDDLHPGNILYDPETAVISVIDIGFGGGYPPEHSFGILRNFYGEVFTEQAMAAFAAESGIQITNDDLDIYAGLQCLVTLWQVEPQEVYGVWAKACPAIEAALDRLAQAPPARQSTAPRPLAVR